MTDQLEGSVRATLAEVRRRVERAGADARSVRIVAVTKGFGAEAVGAAVANGIDDVGENYAQELLAKSSRAPASARWHFVGAIQRNKVRSLSGLVRAWHAVDRLSEARAVAAASPGVEVMVQVNVTGDSAKAGCAPEDLEELVAQCRCLPIDLSGLMTVGPRGDREESRRCFRWLAGRARGLGLRELSMGMSDDYEAAVAEGATTLRLGRLLFGPRPGRTASRL